MFTPFRFVSAALLIAATLASPLLAELEWQSSRYSSRPYQSFDLPSANEYEGDTAFVRYVPPPEAVGNWSTGLSGVVISSNFAPAVPPPVIRQRPPIELTEFVASHSANTEATVAETRHDIGTARSFDHSNESGEELANYSHVRSETVPLLSSQSRGEVGPLLAFAEAFSEQTAEADDLQFEASGRVHSNADILQVLSGDTTHARSTGETYLMTEYHLTQAHDFIMDIELSTNESDAEFSFQLHDLTTDEVVLDWSSARNERMRYEHCGTLLPGTYKFIVETQSDSAVGTQATPDSGGFGEFDVYFRAFYPHGDIVPVLHPSERRKPGVWYTDGVSYSELIAPVSEPSPQGETIPLLHPNGSHKLGDIRYTDEVAGLVASVPEPSTNSMLWITILLIAGRSLKRRRCC